MSDRGGIAIAIAIGGVLAIAIATGTMPVVHAAGETGLRLKCRAFQTALDAEIDTRDPEAELGQWVLDHEDRGWKVQTVQLEVGQKQTGFPQGWAYVCLRPL
jgi:hypothetical protein